MFKRETNTTDFGFLLIVAVVAVIAVWLLLTPFVPSVASSTLRRFHLRGDSFAWWSIQQPIPSMYNFANVYEIRDVPPGLIEPIFADQIERRYINHFPARVLTWAGRRYRYLHDGKDRWVKVETSYRGLKLTSRFHAKPDGAGGFELVRLPDEAE
jgi:hypothetical protein